MPHYTQRLSSEKKRNSISGAKIQHLFELIKEKLNKKQNDDDLINENDNDNENNTRCVGCE